MRVPFVYRFLLVACAALSLRAERLDNTEAQARVEARLAEVQQWAADPALIAAVAAQNSTPPAEHATLTQENWAALSELDPLVRTFSKNTVASALRAKKPAWVNEAFVSDARGHKVAFLAKTSNWSHAGKPKHDVPMSGKTWQGKIEVDESTRASQLQIAVPVLQDGKPIGSLVVGIALGRI